MDVYMHICISNFPKPKFWLLPLNLCLSNSAWDHRNKLNRIIDASQNGDGKDNPKKIH